MSPQWIYQSFIVTAIPTTRALNTLKMSFVTAIKPIFYDLQSINFLLQKDYPLGNFIYKPTVLLYRD
ncbi:hypothetical protein NTGHW29_840002 [Candidatus Nitrotoga sp. HW29]|nr:hypothetical protein NTGHW29_840002 [Candidatus Nitrotoga sp. HW29]